MRLLTICAETKADKIINNPRSDFLIRLKMELWPSEGLMMIIFEFMRCPRVCVQQKKKMRVQSKMNAIQFEK